MNYNIEKFLISIKKWISSIEEVIVDKFIDLENKLDNKTEKVRIDIVDTDNNGFAFKKGEDILNFKELNDLLQNSPDFLVFVYGKREHRCTMIDMDSNPRQMRFIAPMLSDNKVKTQSFYVTSLDGVEITSITRSDINCENSSNKVTEITESNKNSNTYYPTVKAVSDKLDDKQDTLVSGQNIATINGESLLNGGDITIQGGGIGDITRDEVYTFMKYFTDPDPEPEYCPSCGSELSPDDRDCHNSDCPNSVDYVEPESSYCDFCGSELDSEGICHNSDCTNSPDYVEPEPEPSYCDSCGSELDSEGICHNTDCVNSPDYIVPEPESSYCPFCGSELDSEGICHNTDCPNSMDYESDENDELDIKYLTITAPGSYSLDCTTAIVTISSGGPYIIYTESDFDLFANNLTTGNESDDEEGTNQPRLIVNNGEEIEILTYHSHMNEYIEHFTGILYVEKYED